MDQEITADYVFIDGCHGAPCVTRDFLEAEKIVRPGGIICFHDTSENCQGNHLQPHCGTGIDARAAVSDLGLLDGTNAAWEYLEETPGSVMNGTHGCLWVRKR